MIYKPQAEFPLLGEFKKLFAVTDKTIFAYDNTIYANYELSRDLEVHEICHLKQQKTYGLDNWVKQYLNDKNFRLEMEIKAYCAQLRSITDREERNFIKRQAAKNLSSDLYGNLLNYEDAFKLLTI